MKPYLNQHGDLVIPFSSPPRYHWWKRPSEVGEEGTPYLSLREILNEITEQT